MFSRIAGAILMTGATLSAVDLVKNGEPCADIVISEKPEPGVLAAAQDLQEHIRLMSGAELKIVTPEESTMPAKICVGESSCSREAGYTAPEFRGSGYDIWVKDSRIVLTGPSVLHREEGKTYHGHLSVVTALRVPGTTEQAPVNHRLGFSLADDLGPMHAVSAFLENLGVRFYAPDRNGTIIPEKKTISIPEGRETREAAFDIREYQYLSQNLDPEGFLWLKRLKGGSARSPRIGVFALADLMREGEKEHPDWIAHGKRGDVLFSHDLCGFPKYLHAGFRQACVEKIRMIFDANPNLKKLIIMPPGSGTRIDAEEIKQIRKPCDPPQDSERAISFEFAAFVARELKKTHPDRQLVWQGPGNDVPPDEDRLAGRPDNLTAAPRARAPHTYGKMSERTRYLKDLTALNEAFRPEGMVQREWWNEFEFCYPTRGLPFWFPKALQEVRKGQRENGVSGFLMDLETAAGGALPEIQLTHLMIYINSKLMWDPELDLDALLSEYCRLWFGPAESEMRCLIYYGADILSRNGTRTVNASEKSQMKFDDVPVIFQLLERAKAKTEPGTLYRSRVEDLERRFAWLKNEFREPAVSEDPRVTAQAFPCFKPCTGDLSAFKNWMPLGSTSGPNRTEIALGVTDNRDRLLVAIRCFDEKMTDLPSIVCLPDDPEMFKGDLFGITLRSPLRGPFFLVVNPDGSFADSSCDPESIIRSGSFTAWSPDITAVKARRLADRWEAEIHFAIGSLGSPWPEETNPPWTLTLDRTRRPGKGKNAENTKGQYALVFPDVDAEGNDIHARRLLPGATDQYVYGVKRAAGAVPLDAAWDGPEWKDIPELRLGINWYRYGLSSDYCPDVRAKLQYDDQYLYVHYLLKDQYVKGEHQNDQDSVCRDSCMEFFAKPNESGPYLNFECSCVGTLLLYHITENADQSKNMVPLELEELARIERFHTLNGPLTVEIEEPTTWRLALRIPLDIFVEHTGIQLPLTGQVWSANFFNCADQTSHPRWLMWKRAKAFHVPEDFGKIIFE